jgi:hypothetical protein
MPFLIRSLQYRPTRKPTVVLSDPAIYPGPTLGRLDRFDVIGSRACGVPPSWGIRALVIFKNDTELTILFVHLNLCYCSNMYSFNCSAQSILGARHKDRNWFPRLLRPPLRLSIHMWQFWEWKLSPSVAQSVGKTENWNFWLVSLFWEGAICILVNFPCYAKF